MLLFAAACVDDGRVTVAVETDTSLRAASSSSADGSALAAALLAFAGEVPKHESLPPAPALPSAALAAIARQRALDHVRVEALAAGDGPGLESSARTRRLAAADDAPRDSNRNGTNLDEVLAAETRALARLAGAEPPAGAVRLVRGDRAVARLADRRGPGDRDDLAAMQTAALDAREVDTARLGFAMLARAWTGAALGRGRRGELVGTSERDGVLALLALQQALALDETLLADLTFDGTSLGAIADPIRYDPAAGARWIPARVRFTPHGDLPDAPGEWFAVDGASDLRATAAILRAAVELAWLTDTQQSEPELGALFVDTPLEPPDIGDPPIDVVTWIDDVRPILHGAAGCISCHAPPLLNGGYSVATYESAIGRGRSNVPIVVAGDAASSPLWIVLNGPWLPPTRPVPVPRMPFMRPPRPQAEIDTIRDWIQDGALLQAPPPPPSPRAGLDLARVLFKNVRALHADPISGLLDRRSGTERSGLATAAETGLLLSALAALAATDGDEPGLRESLLAWAIAAREHLTRDDGSVVGELDLTTLAADVRPADLRARAALGAGLLAAGRVTRRGDLMARGRAIAEALVADSWRADLGLFDTVAGRPSRHLASEDLAIVLDLLRELQLAGDTDAIAIAERLLVRALPVLTASELDGLGEVIGDGIADTDRNGVVEPGANGLAPLLLDGLLHGPAGDIDDAPITWSRHVLPLLRARCVSCHLDGGERGEYRLDTPALAARAGESRATNLIVPGEPDASLLYRKLAERTPPVGAQMPLDAPPLEPRDLALVRRWIAEGARDR